MDRAAFDIDVETQLAPVLLPGTVVILQPVHQQSSKVVDLLKARGCWMLFLPAYSPDLNPIEMAFSKLKAHLRRVGARTYDTLIRALAISAASSIPMSAGISSKLQDMRQIKSKPL